MKQKENQYGLMYRDGIVVLGEDAPDLHQMHQNFVSQFGHNRGVKDQKGRAISNNEDGEQTRK